MLYQDYIPYKVNTEHCGIKCFFPKQFQYPNNYCFRILWKIKTNSVTCFRSFRMGAKHIKQNHEVKRLGWSVPMHYLSAILAMVSIFIITGLFTGAVLISRSVGYNTGTWGSIYTLHAHYHKLIDDHMPITKILTIPIPQPLLDRLNLK